MGLEIAGEAVDAEELIAEVETTCPDLVLLDWRLRGRAVTDLLHTLRRMCPDLYVIVLSGRPEERQMALAAGADAFVSKVDPPESLLAAIRSVQRVEAALTSLVAQTLGVC
jgi:DNA-binding NarL/FixJ family response regulator